jgi:type I restriction enzyme R subunit
MSLNEDTLVQQTAADYLRDALGWESIFAYNQENYGEGSLLGRKDQREAVLLKDVRAALKKLNPDLPDAAYHDAERQLVGANASLSLIAQNQEKYALVRDGVPVTYRDADGNLQKKRLSVVDFDNASNNRFAAVRELWIQGDIYRRRADIVCFVNDLPLIFIECKAIHEKPYLKRLIPRFFYHDTKAKQLKKRIERQKGNRKMYDKRVNIHGGCSLRVPWNHLLPFAVDTALSLPGVSHLYTLRQTVPPRRQLEMSYTQAHHRKQH